MSTTTVNPPVVPTANPTAIPAATPMTTDPTLGASPYPTAATPMTTHPSFTSPQFQQVYNKWGNQQWSQDQVVNPNYSDVTGQATTDLEVLFNNVLRDPRLNRLRTKCDPTWSATGGPKQKVKNFVDPINIPYVGTAVAWTRASRNNKNTNKLEKIKEENSNTQYDQVLNSMHTNMKVNQAGLTAKATAKTFFMFFPVVYAVPVGDQAISSVASKAASKGAAAGVQKASQAAANEKEQDSAQLDANSSWGFSKAFLLYLGVPYNNDPIYQTWEDSRIQLKEFFGSNAQDDLWQMEPKGDDLKRIEEAENTKGGYDLNTINVPLLVLLWRIYECWDTQYADKITSKKHKMNNEKRFRTEDERQVLEMISPIDPHVQHLNETSTKEIVRMLRAEHPMAYGNHGIFSFLEEKSEAKREKRLKWMLNTFVGQQLKSGTGWGFFSDPTNSGKQGELQAVLFFERAEDDHYDPSDLLKTFSGMMNLRSDYSSMSSRLNWEDSVMRTHVGKDENNYPGIVHFYGCLNTPEGSNALSTLMRSQIMYTSVPSYVQEYSSETQRIQFLEAIGFKRKNISQEDTDKHLLNSKDTNSPRLEPFEYIPAERSAAAYKVPPPDPSLLNNGGAGVMADTAMSQGTGSAPNPLSAQPFAALNPNSNA